LNESNDSSEESDYSDVDDDDVEVASNVDEQENELINMSAYLRIGSTEESDGGSDDESLSTVALGNTYLESDSDSEGDSIDNSAVPGGSITASSPLSLSTTLASSTSISASAIVTPKRKRRRS
jgi:hypothetical protein